LEHTFGAKARALYGEILASMLGDDMLGTLDREFISAELRGDSKNRRKRPDATVEELFSRVRAFEGSEPFLAGVDFVKRLKEYSAYNNMLVYLQRPKLLYYASPTDWAKRFQRKVKKTAVPIVILRPMGPIMLVYDAADTDGPSLPEHLIRPFTVEGRYDPSWMARLVDDAKRDGIDVAGARLGGRLAGLAKRKKKAAEFSAVLNHDLAEAEQFATLCHELAHIYLGHVGGASWPSRLHLRTSQRELEAEAVAHVVAGRLGLTTLSAEYLAGYAAGPEDYSSASLEMVTSVATRLEEVIKPIRR
jgi:hypothetical protein